VLFIVLLVLFILFMIWALPKLWRAIKTAFGFLKRNLSDKPEEPAPNKLQSSSSATKPDT
jgi:Sec-independent protein translocase protein TatA